MFEPNIILKQQGLFILNTDASKTRLGAILSEIQDLQEHELCYLVVENTF